MQQAKAGKLSIEVLLDDARAIEDPSFAAEALFWLSDDERLELKQATKVLHDVVELARGTERGWRKAELLAHFAKKAPTWRELDEGSEVPLARFQNSVLDLALQLEGKDLTAVLPAMGKWCPETRVAELLKHALVHGSDPADDAKLILMTGPAPGVDKVIHSISDATLRARLLSYLHGHGGDALGASLDAAFAAPADKQVDAVRAVIASIEDPADLMTVASRIPADAEPHARLMSALAARADKLGQKGQAAAWFIQADVAALQMPAGKAREKVLANIAAGRERLSAGAPPKKAAPPAEAPAPAAPLDATSKRHLLGLYDTYEGGLSEVHFRAIARAAPLCVAFELDLGLFGFPATDLAALVAQTAKETRIGGDADAVRRLAAEGRIQLVACTKQEPPADWKPVGLPVATTSEPEAGKATDFAGALAACKTAKHRRIALLMGLGKHGLPPSLLKATQHHLEITGQRVSLETATAMGILAERLRQVAQA